MDALCVGVLWIFNVGDLGVWVAGFVVVVDFLVVVWVYFCLWL